MNILGISCYYHDSSAVLIQNGKIVAAISEERLSRRKHDNGFPKQSISWCLSWANLNMKDIDLIAFYEKPLVKFERVLAQHLETFPRGNKVFRENIPSWFSRKLKIKETLKKDFGYDKELWYIPHHLSHAASAFYLSGFRKAAVVTIDGVGEWATTTTGMANGTDIIVQQEIRFPHSLGLLYSAITAYLGFEVNDAEYKVMGYAAYGNPETYRDKFQQLIHVFPDGSFELNPIYFTYTWSDRMYNKKLEQLFGLPTRPKESGVQQNYADIAAGLQETLETAVISLLEATYKRYKTKNLCMAGGVALNSVMNGKLLSHTPFTNLYIPPDPGDAGGAMGAALYASVKKSEFKTKNRFFPNLGPSYSSEQILSILETFGLSYKKYESNEQLIETVSDHLVRQKVIGWFQGRMEWGPRALGFRSILASAGKSEMKDIINAKIKHRELFRPFAPVILKEKVSEYFKTDVPLPESAKYMLCVYPFTKKGIRRVPATVHVDNTGRLQVIERDDNPLYYDLIREFWKKTGTPVILNTSFNVRGEPIVCTPRDAIECFLKTDIDYLVLGQYIVSK